MDHPPDHRLVFGSRGQAQISQFLRNDGQAGALNIPRQSVQMFAQNSTPFRAWMPFS